MRLAIAYDIAIVLLGCMIPAILIGWGWRRHWERILPQRPNLPTLPDATELFRDDGERIEVGIRRARVVDVLLMQYLFMVICVIAIVLVLRLPHPDLQLMQIVPMLALFLALLVLTNLLNVARLLRRGPALLITSDGIEDHASLTCTGLGLIRWHEIQLVMPMDASRKSARGWRQLAITLVNRRVVFHRQPRWKRLLRALLTLGRPPLVYISGYYLSAGADDLVERINDFVEAHAPPGWVWPGIRRFLDDQDEATEADSTPGERDS